jgi:2-polyprenyl-3-methyl-5-hydroxy-6-metoxy-1,4-benzoquinol methylase
VAQVDSTNAAKFRSRNPVVSGLIDRFYSTLRALVFSLEPTPESVLDAGCGEGETVARLADCLPRRVTGVDVRQDCVEFTRDRLPWADVSCQSVYELAFDDQAFDLVLCLEVLEHLDAPADALSELCRVTRRDVILSVPREPWFRIGSLVRGKHISRLGNHPEHIQSWDRRGFEEFLASRVEIVSLITAFPWLIAHCRPVPGRP